jgi:hypothetical protein
LKIEEHGNPGAIFYPPSSTLRALRYLRGKKQTRLSAKGREKVGFLDFHIRQIYDAGREILVANATLKMVSEK